MSAVIGNGDTAQKLLNVIRRMEFCQNFRTSHYLTNLIHISADTSNIHRDNDFGAFRDSISQFIVIHLDIVLLRIHHDNVNQARHLNHILQICIRFQKKCQM